mmetsp:Transcript_13485/g.23790  ORF Transcript_13485/g.23790 Transcript_13485/m.23790 type:complete len:201 (-) Transcript_13485:308-910(-)
MASPIDRDAMWLESATLLLDETCRAARVRHRADTVFLVMMGGRIMSMQSGFGMVESAFTRPMNSANVMMKNVYDMFIGMLAFYFIGYQICYGVSPVSWEEDPSMDWADWFVQFTYCTTAATITSGALAGRVAFLAYLVLSFVITGFIYPVVVQWVWGDGWLSQMGYVDFAGGTVVHLVGAVCSLVGICVCGPRVQLKQPF